MANYRRKSKLKSILCGILVVATLIGACAGIASISKKETKTLSPGIFSRGGLNENGEHIITNQTIYTKEAFACEGLRIEPDFEFKGTYDVYYYNADMGFLESRSGLTGIHDEDYPLADYARVVIKPDIKTLAAEQGIKEKDFKISFYEVRSYAKELDITVNKAQDKSEIRTENLYKDSEAIQGQTFDATKVQTPLVFESDADAKLSADIGVSSDISHFEIYVMCSERMDLTTVAVIADKNGDAVYDRLARKDLSYDSGSVGVWNKIVIDVPDLEDIKGESVLKLRMDKDCQCVVYGIYAQD